MALHSSSDEAPWPGTHREPVAISLVPYYCQLQTVEQVRSFDLLRLACFALKLRKLERSNACSGPPLQGEYELHCKLLRHAIFQQILALIAQDAREQAFQLLDACLSIDRSNQITSPLLPPLKGGMR